jgi:Uma2 family endonuclease
MTQRAPDTFEWTYDEYARLPDDGDRYEVIRGQVVVTPGPSPRHQWVLKKLYRQVDEYVERHRLGLVFHGVDLLFVSGEYLRPDMLFVPADRLEGITSRGIEVAPDLVVEVLSPGCERTDRDLKPPRYGEHGVPAYWLVDTTKNAIEVYRLPDSVLHIVVDRLEWQPDPAAPPLVIDVAGLFESW